MLFAQCFAELRLVALSTQLSKAHRDVGDSGHRNQASDNDESFLHVPILHERFLRRTTCAPVPAQTDYFLGAYIGCSARSKLDRNGLRDVSAMTNGSHDASPMINTFGQV